MTLKLSRSLLAASLALALGTFAPGVFAEPHAQVLAHAEQYKGEALKLLERLVNIDSGSGYEPGLTQVGDIAIEELKKLGATIERVPNTPDKSSHVIGQCRTA